MKNTVICLAGPTGSGKSEIASCLGRDLGGIVINTDSRQVYADFPIITAQPGENELSRCPHTLYGFLPTAEKISAGQYVDLAVKAIESSLGQGKIPILTGGTGLYFRALMRGIADIPAIPEKIHEKWQYLCEKMGSHALYERLRGVDEPYSSKIHPNDRQRVTRALEVHEATGRPLSWWHQGRHTRNRFEYIYLGLDVTLRELEPLLKKRIDAMLEKGALYEAAQALRICSSPDAPGWSGIGSAELYRVVTGYITIGEAKVLWYKNTRAYAKRQITWFRGESILHRHKAADYSGILGTLRSLLKQKNTA